MKLIFKSFAILLLMALLAIGVIWYQYASFLSTPAAITSENEYFEVKPGSNVRQVTEQLQSKGIIQNKWWFLAHARFSDMATKLKAGEYKLETGMKPDDILKKLASGQTVQYQLIVLEGKTFKELMANVRNSPFLQQTLKPEDYPKVLQQLGGTGDMHPEGWFYADTYSFHRKTTDVEFLKRSYTTMQNYLQKAWANREPNPTIKTPYDALILASIVEKETGLAEERPLVARVFLNRLEKGMLLQTDPTVIYGIGDAYNGNIRKTDLQTDTPYNTYTRKGLPPTPIAIPGKAAIDAVMHPANSKALYFVATAPGAASHFSETLAEHNKAVQNYILNRKKVVSAADKKTGTETAPVAPTTGTSATTTTPAASTSEIAVIPAPTNDTATKAATTPASTPVTATTTPAKP